MRVGIYVANVGSSSVTNRYFGRSERLSRGHIRHKADPTNRCRSDLFSYTGYVHLKPLFQNKFLILKFTRKSIKQFQIRIYTNTCEEFIQYQKYIMHAYKRIVTVNVPV